MSGLSMRSLLTAAVSLSLAGGASAQFYSFTSGPSGDGFIWDEFPQGGLNNLADGGQFDTPDGVSFNNFMGNNSFFDSQYQAAGNAPNISGDAWWGNPLSTGGADIFIGFFNSPTGGPSSVSFDFAWAIAGEDAPDFLELYVFDFDAGPGGDETYETFVFVDLNEVWNAGGTFGGFNGRSGNVLIDVNDLFDDNSGEPFSEIEDIGFYLGDIETFGGTSEFAIDNVSVDGSSGGGGEGEVFPSVNQGDTDVTGSTLGNNTLRGTGTFGHGLSVTNDSGTATTYSIELVPGGDLAAGTLPNGDPIADGQTIFNPDAVTVDRSLPSGTYESDLTIINDGDPGDPDNVVTMSIDLYEPQQLSGNFAGVNVSAAQQITLSNAPAPANGFRAAVKVTSFLVDGPFDVTGINIDDRVLDGDDLQASATFNRFGQLSGLRTGTFTVTLEQAAYVVNEFVDLEVFLGNKEAVPDAVWTLNYTNVNANSDFGSFSPGGTLVGRIGVNTFDVAATFIEGTSDINQNISMQITANPDTSGSADLIGDAVDVVFGVAPDDLFVLQLTYNDGSLPAGATEADLDLLWFDTVAQQWTDAVDGNTAGTPTPFFGSFEDYLAELGGGTFDAGDLGAFGVDTFNNHVWAVLNHASLFAVGAPGSVVLPGDTDGDGDIDDSDLGTAFSNYTGPLAPGTGGKTAADGDTDGDGDVDDTDLGTLFSSYTGPLGPTNVPEPASAALLALGGLLVARRRR
ncbi:MAG: PEP-CTERM sorting domain-containing protein [Phycisphaeraceae bacterium]